MSARDQILARLRAAVTVPEAMPEVGNARKAEKGGVMARVARLREALVASHAEVHDTDCASWPAVLLGIIAQKGLRTLLVGAGTADSVALEAQHPDKLVLIRYERPIEEFRDQLFDAIDASLTRARSAIAQTGSLILWPDAQQPRLMSLVPPVHFVLLDTATIHADLHGAIVAENWRERMPGNALLISGPSKTADIQQTLAYGAHGPRELIVLLCHAAGAAA